MEEKNQLPVVVMAAACLYFVLVLCKSYKETGDQMSTGEFATANKGPLAGLVACVFGVACLTAPKGGSVMSFGDQPDVLMDLHGFYDSPTAAAQTPASPVQP